MYILERLNQELLHPVEQMHSILFFFLLLNAFEKKKKKKKIPKEDTADTNIQTHTIVFIIHNTCGFSYLAEKLLIYIAF